MTVAEQYIGINPVTQSLNEESAAEKLGLIRKSRNQSSQKSLSKTDILELEIQKQVAMRRNNVNRPPIDKNFLEELKLPKVEQSYTHAPTLQSLANRHYTNPV